MKPEVEKFVTQYNRRVDWDMEILSKINLELIKDNKCAKDIVDTFLTDEKIYATDCDLENAQVYKLNTDDNKYEMRVYNKSYCGSFFYWIIFDQDKESYIKERLKLINETRDRLCKEKLAKIKELSDDLSCIYNFYTN